jgi:hypothetical protein
MKECRFPYLPLQWNWCPLRDLLCFSVFDNWIILHKLDYIGWIWCWVARFPSLGVYQWGKRELIRVRHIQIIVGLCYLVCVVCSRWVLWMIDRLPKFAHKNRLQYHVVCISKVLHFPSDLLSWDCCYKKFPRETQNLNQRKLVARWWESVEKRMLESMLSMELVSSRKSDCRGKACQEGKPREEIIVSSRKRYISLS